MRRRDVWFTLGLVFVGGGAAIACGEDDPTTSGTTSDGGTSDASDSGAKADSGSTSTGDAEAGTPDAGDAGSSDAGTADADVDADAGPGVTVTTGVGPTGLIELDDVGAIALFYEDDTIVHVSDAANCVAHLRSETKPASTAGTITVGGDIVGAVGGPAAAVDIAPDPADPTNFYFSADLVFPADDLLSLEVTKTATTVFPAIAATTLKTPPAGTVIVSQPAKPDAGDLEVSSANDLAFAWTPPASTAGQSLSVRFSDLVTNGKRANVMCQFPLAAGSGHVPSSLLSHVRTWLGGEATGLIVTNAGGAAEVKAGAASFVVFTARADSTNHSNSADFIAAKLK